MGKSELQTALSDWNKRAAQYAAAGIPQEVYLPIAQHDFQNTFSNDSQPMTSLEANLAVMSAFQNHPEVQQSPRHAGGILGDIGTVASNLIPNAQNIITGLPSGLAHLGEELVNPKTYETDAKVLGDVVRGKEKGGLGGDLRALAGAPLLGLVPGLTDAAALTTKAGRQSLLENPITAAADVAPFAGPATRLGASTAMVGLSDADRAAIASSPTALAAAAAGKPILFGLRTADRSVFSKAALSGKLGSDIQRVAQRAQAAGDDPYFQLRGLQAGQSLGLGQYAARKSLARISMDPLGRQISTAVSRKMGDVYRQSDLYKARLNEIYQPILEEGGPRALASFSDKIRKGDFSNLTPAETAALPKIREVETEIRDRGLRSGDLAQTDIGVYSSSAPPALNYAKLQKAKDDLAAAMDSYDSELARSADIQAQGRAVPQISVTTPDLAPEGKGGPGLEPGLPAKMGEYTRVVPKREAEAAAKLKKAQQKHDAALKRYQKSYLKNPPPVLHPTLKDQMRSIVEADYRARNNVAATAPSDQQVANAATSGKLGEFQEAIKTIQNTQSLQKLKSYMGADEWKQAWSDIVNTTLKEAREGFAPVYFHDVAAKELERGNTFRVRVVKDAAQDVTEGPYREKAFGVSTGSVFNVYAGQVQAGMETIARDGMRVLHDEHLKPMTRTHDDLEGFYRKIAEQTFHKRTQQSLGGYAHQLMMREWAPYEFDNKGMRWDVTNPTPKTTYLPKDVARNLQSFAKNENRLFSNPVYRGGMKIFRTSVLYGPRHWAHIVIGGLMPISLAHPGAYLDMVRAFPHFRALMDGTEDEKVLAMPGLYKHPSNWTLDNAMDLQVGYKMGSALKEFWNKTGVRLSDGMKRVEDMAQSMYQYGVYANQVRKGADPEVALEEGRRMVVNMDSMAPFERTIMKQVMPFYSFTRFAMSYLLRFPLDHPLRYSVLTKLGTQASQDWQNSGLPLDMMSLIYFGKPNKNGNVFTISYRNANPFRSVFNVFTFGGFLSSLNPAISSAFAFTGGDVLAGTGGLYPKQALNSQTGGLAASRPAGDFLQGLEQFVPELNWPDLWFGVSSNTRKSDPQAFQRELWNAANLPFTPSSYNVPVERAKVEASNYKLAQQSVTGFTKTLNPEGEINRFNLIPFQGKLYTPGQFEKWYDNLAKQYERLYPGIDPKALIPSSSVY